MTTETAVKTSLWIDKTIADAIDQIAQQNNVKPATQLRLMIFKGLKTEGIDVKGGKIQPVCENHDK